MLHEKVVPLVLDGLQEMDQKRFQLSSSGYFNCEGSSRVEEVCLVFKVRFQNCKKWAHVLAHQWERVRLLAFQWEILKKDSFHISSAPLYF